MPTIGPVMIVMLQGIGITWKGMSVKFRMIRSKLQIRLLLTYRGMVLWNEGLLVVRLPVLAGSNLALLLSAQDGKQQGLPCSDLLT
jgi:hypothetical protein